MKRSSLLSLTMFLATTSAFADTFNFTFGDATIPPFHGSPASGSGQFTATPTLYAGVTPAFLVTAVTGTATFNGLSTPITGIAPLGAGFQGNDNILFFPAVNGNDFFNGHGTAFTLGNGVIVDLYAIGGIYLTIPGQPALPETGSVSVTAATPEASSLSLLATGCLGVALMARRRFSQARPTL